MFDEGLFALIGQGLLETLYMTLISTLMAYVIGLPVGMFLAVTDKEGIRPMPTVNRIVGGIVNILRSVPFVILLVAIMPFTRFITGAAIGSTATIVPLVIAAAPFVARLVESSAKEVDRGVVEASLSMGASTLEVVWKVLLPEAKPSLIVGAAIATTTILGYTTMSGFTGGGGLGTIAINYGYYRSQTDMMLVMVVVLVIIVQIFQEIGTFIANKCDKRIR
ncbi:MAG: ABC transporter permease [Clostridiaceae bacterium]|mgnify:CR=1 FL=1|jgi:D-methionine transport system permease protein|nr:ABC transporter permease [Clostridiaceae bacterium]